MSAFPLASLSVGASSELRAELVGRGLRGGEAGRFFLWGAACDGGRRTDEEAVFVLCDCKATLTRFGLLELWAICVVVDIPFIDCQYTVVSSEWMGRAVYTFVLVYSFFASPRSFSSLTERRSNVSSSVLAVIAIIEMVVD
jgi:hypothetical protein